MSETGPTSEMAEKVSDELFKVFGWEKVGPKNQDWKCVNHEVHKTKDGTHPSDVVFRYNDPHSNYTIYINFDLKSYAGKSIDNKTAITIALNSLANATNCANTSEEWADLYTRTGEHRKTYGLLFIYNHDAEYDADFSKVLERIEFDRVPLAKNNRIYVYSPQLISYLTTLAHDITLCYSNGSFTFYYPDMIFAHPRDHDLGVASVDYLIGPWQVIKGKRADGQEQINCYYSGEGKTSDEFKFLIDFFFRFQLVDKTPISLRLPHACDEAMRVFQKSKAEYACDFYELEEFKKRLDLINYYPLTTTIKRFSKETIGMEVR